MVHSALSNLYHFYSLYSTRKYVGMYLPASLSYSPFLSSIIHTTLLIYYSHLHLSHRTTEHFSNGITIISLYLNPLPNSNAPPIEHSIFQVMKEVSLLYCLPDNPFFSSTVGSRHAVQDAAYACTYLPFYCHSLNPFTDGFPRSWLWPTLISQLDSRNTKIVAGSSHNTSVTVSAQPISGSRTSSTKPTRRTLRS